MTDLTIDRMTDTWADQARPGTNFASGAALGLKTQSGATRWAYIKPALDALALLGRTVESATLTGHTREAGVVSQTLTVNMLGEATNLYALTYTNRPSAVLPLATGTLSSGMAPGSPFTIDVTNLIQAVADGQAWHGFRISTSAAANLWLQSDDSGQPAWSLSITLSEAPEQPSGLRPNGGAVGTQKPILGWDGADGAVPQAAFRVRIYSSEASGTPVHDSGWVASVDPEYDLSASSYTPVSTPWWTVQTRSAGGVESEVSDRAFWTYAAMPTLVMDTPTGGVIGDPTPPITAHLSSGTLRGWRVRVTGGNRSNLRYDSGFRSGPLDFTLPRRHEGRLVLLDESPAWLHVRAFDSVERVSAPGQPTYAEQWIPIEWDDDAGVTAPTNLTVTQHTDGDPRMVWKWQCAVRPEGAWLLQANGMTLLRVDAADVDPVGGWYTYTDQGQVPPLRTNSLRVRATDTDGGRSAPSNAVTKQHTVIGVVLVPLDGGETITLAETSVEGIARADRFERYEMQDGTTADILYGQGPLAGALDLSTSAHASAADTYSLLDRFDALTSDERVIPRVQLVWGSRSIRARILSPHHVPSPDILPNNNLHRVRFEFVQED